MSQDQGEVYQIAALAKAVGTQVPLTLPDGTVVGTAEVTLGEHGFAVVGKVSDQRAMDLLSQGLLDGGMSIGPFE